MEQSMPNQPIWQAQKPPMHVPRPLHPFRQTEASMEPQSVPLYPCAPEAPHQCQTTRRHRLHRRRCGPKRLLGGVKNKKAIKMGKMQTSEGVGAA